MKLRYVLLALIAALSCFAVSGYDDFDGAMQEQERYCAAVKNGEHSDYKGYYQQVCVEQNQQR